MDNYEKEMLDKIDSSDDLTERELKSLPWEFNEIERTYGDNRRWARKTTSIIEIGGRFFKLDWDEGLTEMQEHEFYYQPVEVKEKTYEKTITVKEWIPVGE